MNIGKTGICSPVKSLRTAVPDLEQHSDNLHTELHSYTSELQNNIYYVILSYFKRK